MESGQVLDLLRETDALLEGHFELSSGLHSDRYFQCARVLQHPQHAETLARALKERLDVRPDVVVGPALGAVTWAHEVARAFGVRGFFSERKDGGMCLRRGFHLDPGERVLVVEDVVTTGGSAREAIEAVRATGAEPIAVGTIVNRSGGNPFADLDLPLTALADVQAEAWEPASCPQCAAGGVAIKPGSRPGAQGAASGATSGRLGPVIRSMTGFGAATLEKGGVSVRVEIRSVNHRHLQVKMRLPSELGHLEPEVEALVRKALERGAVTLNASVARAPDAGEIQVNGDVAGRYRDLLTKLAEKLDLDPNIDLGTLVTLPGVLDTKDGDGETTREEKLLLRGVKEALGALVEMREREGASLEADLRRNATAVERLRTKVDKRMPIVVKAHHANLRKRLEELLGGRSPVQEADLGRELALLADRMDVSEEVSRLESHLGQLDTLLDKGGASGRKLDFLVQELFREANTIGSKCNDATVSHAVIELKTHIERLREQVQNVE